MTRDDGPGRGDDTSGVSGDGLIYPEAFAGKSRDLDIEAIRASAAALKALGTDVAVKTGDVNAVWGGLQMPGVYESPEASRVYTLLVPAVNVADGIEEDFTAGAKCLDTFADELDFIKPKLADLEVRANAFRARVFNGVEVKADPTQRGIGDQTGRGAAWEEATTKTVPWNQDTATVAENQALVREYFALVEQITMSSYTCARGIKAIAGTLVDALSGGSNMTGVITAEQLEAGGPLPFGYPAEENRDCGEQVADSIMTFGRDTGQGAGMLLLGYNPETRQINDPEARRQAWGGLVNVVGSVIVCLPAKALADVIKDMGGETPFTAWADERVDVAAGAVGSMIGWDQAAWREGGDGWHVWKDTPAGAVTTSVLNIGTFFIPTAAVASGAKAGTLGARAATAAATTAEVIVPGGSWVLKGGVNVVRAGEAAVTVARGGTLGVLDASRLGKAGIITNLDHITDAATFTPGRPKVTDQLFNSNVTKPTTPRLDAPGGARLGNPSSPLPEHGSVTKPGAGDNTPGLHRAGVEADLHRTFGEDPYVRPDHVLPDATATPAPERVPALVGAVEHEAGRVDLTEPGHVTNSIDTPSRTAGHADTGGQIDTTTNGTRTGGGDAGAGSGGGGRGAGNTTGSGGGHDAPGAGGGSGGGGLPDGSGIGPRVHPDSGKPIWDPDTSPRNTLSQKEAHRAADYYPEDVERAFDKAPVNEKGQPVDHRDGRPLNEPGTNGERRWQMAWDPERGEWVAQNPGKGQTPDGWDLYGEPNTYGYDSNGNLMQYVADRPKYADGQVVEVWRNASDAWSKDPNTGVWIRDPNIPDVVPVDMLDGTTRYVTWDSTASPLPGRTGPTGWDMGHLPEHEYRTLLDQYLNHELGPDDATNLQTFLDTYRDPTLYEPQDPSRNRSHKDEAP